MKNSYRRLKISILLQSVFVTALAVFVGDVILGFLYEKNVEKPLGLWLIGFLEKMGLNENEARTFYTSVISENKAFWTTVGFLLLFTLFFYLSLRKMTKYLVQLEEGIENLRTDSTESIRLIDEFKPIEMKLNEIKATLKRQEIEHIEGEKKKTDMILFLAHDLKTPLTSMVAYLSMLKEYPEMPYKERKKYTEIALSKSVRLGELIDEFFDIARYNMLNIELEKVDINFSRMIEQIADELYGVLQEKGLSCRVQVEDDIIICGDPDKLARVFENILRNAVTYCNDNSTIEIAMCVRRHEAVITITNEGMRIPGDMLQTIFEKFYRVDNARSSETGGAGLGLAIAKEIVEMHGGHVRASSDDLKTSFVVSLPLKEKEEGKKESLPAEKKSFKRKKDKSGQNQ